MKNNSVIDILFSKDDQGENVRKSKFFSRELSGSMTKRNKKHLSKSLFKVGKYISEFLSRLTARSYGTVLFCFGIISTLMYFLNLSFDNDFKTPIIGAVICILSIPFLIFDKPLSVVLQKFRVTDYLFYEFFCMKRHNDLVSERRLPFIASVLLGAIPAALSRFAPLWQVALAVVIIIVIYVGMESPESVFLMSLFALPYLVYINYSDIILVAAVALASISFIRKVIYGKRVLCIEQYDIFIGLMMIFLLISGVFFKGSESFSGSVHMIILALGYMLAGNIITNRRLAERVINSIVISGCVAAIISVIQLSYLLFKTGGSVDLVHLNLLLARTDGMAMFFIVSTLFSLGMMKQQSKKNGIYAIPALLSFIALVLSGEFFGIIVLLVLPLAYYVIKANRLTVLILPVLICAPLVVLFLPNNLLNMLFYYSPSIVSAEKLFELWNNSLEVFFNNLFFGVGVGSESFAQEMAAYGMIGYADSSNLLIELGIEAGVFALLALLCVLITRVRHRSIQHIYVRNSQIRALSTLSESCMFCMLSFGMINYIWSNPSEYYLFWCVFGIGSGLLRFAKKDYDDKVLYYEEASAHDSSVIDIEIG